MDENDTRGKQQCLLWMAIGRSVGTAAVATNVPPAGQQSSRAPEAAEQEGSSACHQRHDSGEL